MRTIPQRARPPGRSMHATIFSRFYAHIQRARSVHRSGGPFPSMGCLRACPCSGRPAACACRRSWHGTVERRRTHHGVSRAPRRPAPTPAPPARPVQLGRDAPQRRLGRQPQDVLDEQALVVARHDVRKDRRHSRDERERHDDAACSTGERARTPAGQPARRRWPTGQGRDLPVVAPLPEGLAVHWPSPTPGSFKRAHVVRRQRPGQALATLPAAPYTPTSSGRRRPCRRRRRQ